MNQLNNTTRNYDPGQMVGFKVSTNDIGAYLRNCVTNAPGLHASTATITNTNAFVVRNGNILGAPITSSATFPTLDTAKDFNGNTVGDLAEAMSRMYTYLATVNPITAANTITVVVGEDFTHARPVDVTKDVNLGDGTASVIGFLYVKNETGSPFVPNTTHLTGVSGLTAIPGDAFGFMPYNATS